MRPSPRFVSGLDEAQSPRKRNETFRIASRKPLKSLTAANHRFRRIVCFQRLRCLFVSHFSRMRCSDPNGLSPTQFPIIAFSKKVNQFLHFLCLRIRDRTRAARNLGDAPPLGSKLNELGRSRLLAPIEVAAQSRIVDLAT